MDRGIPSDEVLAEMRKADPPVSYLVGTPRAGFPNWRRRCSNCPGRRFARGSMSSFSRILRQALRTGDVRAGAEPRTHQQGTRDAATQAQMAMGASRSERGDGESLTRGTAHEA